MVSPATSKAGCGCCLKPPACLLSWVSVAQLFVLATATTGNSSRHSLVQRGLDCNRTSVRLKELAGQDWQFTEFYDCYSSDVRNIKALPDSGDHLTNCAKECLEEPTCTGFNFPRGQLGPKELRRCFLKFRADTSLKTGMQCSNGRVTEYYDFYTLIRRTCGRELEFQKEKGIIKAAEMQQAASGDRTGSFKVDLGDESGAQTSEDVVPKEVAPPLPPPHFCHEDDVVYEPIDMNYSNAIIYADDIEDCQSKCRTTAACGFFTWYEPLKTCHHESPMAEKKTGRLGFQGGPALCKGDGGQGARTSTVNNLNLKDECMSNFSYIPLWGRGRPSSYVDSPIACQQECAEVDWCHSFVYNVLTKSCDLQDGNATRSVPAVYQISGPPTCDTELIFDMEIRGARVPNSSERVHREEVKSFMDVLEAAVIKTFSNYTPYKGPAPSEPRPLLNSSAVHFEVDLHGNSDLAIVTVSLQVAPRRAEYVKAMLRSENVSEILQENADNFVEFYGKDSAPHYFSHHISISHVHNVHISIKSPVKGVVIEAAELGHGLGLQPWSMAQTFMCTSLACAALGGVVAWVVSRRAPKDFQKQVRRALVPQLQATESIGDAVWCGGEHEPLQAYQTEHLIV